MRTTNITEAKAKLSQLVEDVRSTGETYRILKGGKIVGVLMSHREYEQMLETLDILSDAKLMKQIRASRGTAPDDLVSHEELFGEPL